jgi:hypothetical protein
VRLGLARGRSHTVAILIPSLTWPWMGEVMQDVADVVESEGYALLLFTCNRGAESMWQFTTDPSADSFDGLLAIEPEGTLSYLAELHARGLPVVLIDDRGHEPPFPPVGTTNRAGARAAADHLLELGRRRPLIITGAQRFGRVRDRRSGFADGYAGAGWPLDPQLELEGDFTYESGRTSAARAVREGLVFDAVFAHNGVMQPPRWACCRRPAGACPRTSPSSGSTTCTDHADHTAADHRPPAGATDGRNGGPGADRPTGRHPAERHTGRHPHNIDRPRLDNISLRRRILSTTLIPLEVQPAAAEPRGRLRIADVVMSELSPTRRAGGRTHAVPVPATVQFVLILEGLFHRTVGAQSA